MAQNKNVTCRYFNKAENYCEKNGENVTEKTCQTCRFNTGTQSHQPQKKKKVWVDPDEIWNKKKAKDKEKQIRQQMIEDLENEDGWV